MYSKENENAVLAFPCLVTVGLLACVLCDSDTFVEQIVKNHDDVADNIFKCTEVTLSLEAKCVHSGTGYCLV